MSKNFPTAKAAFDLETFTFNGHALRTVVIDGKPWFVSSDVARCLNLLPGDFGYNAKRLLDATEHKVVHKRILEGHTVNLTV